MSKIKASKLWDSLVTHQFAKIDNNFLSSFRQPRNSANRIATWDPYERTARHFKFLLFNHINQKSQGLFTNYEKFGLTSIGNLISIRTDGRPEIKLGHLLSVEEFIFLEANMPLGEVKHM